MGMMAAKHTDPIVGMDMHMIQPPPPAPPVMVPHPVAGMVMDPADYSPGACTVYINGLPRARAGNLCMMSPPHIPIGGMFVKPPLSETELYQGSSTVTADGEALSAMSHQVLGCHDVGMPAPVRAWKSGGAKSLMMAGSVVLPMAGGLPVTVGGAPTTAAQSDASTRTTDASLALTVIDQFGHPLEGIRVDLHHGEQSISGATDSDGKVNADRLTSTRIQVRFVDLQVDLASAVADKTLGTPEPVPADSIWLRADSHRTWCATGQQTILVEVPTLRLVLHLLDLQQSASSACFMLASDDDAGVAYSQRLAVDGSVNVTRIDDEYLALVFRNVPEGRTYSLRYEPGSGGGTPYYVFRKNRVPVRRIHGTTFLPTQ